VRSLDGAFPRSARRAPRNPRLGPPTLSGRHLLSGGQCDQNPIVPGPLARPDPHDRPGPAGRDPSGPESPTRSGTPSPRVGIGRCDVYSSRARSGEARTLLATAEDPPCRPPPSLAPRWPARASAGRDRSSRLCDRCEHSSPRGGIPGRRARAPARSRMLKPRPPASSSRSSRSSSAAAVSFVALLSALWTGLQMIYRVIQWATGKTS
jgi:hypothetical protein